MSSAFSRYIGRYAPSPTGPLHFGSLVAAVASYLDARSQKGKWLLRMEDLDKPREMPGAADDILRTLDAYGFEWDGKVMYQSQRHDAYQAVLDKLISEDLVYPCNCSRREIADIAHAGIEGPVYPGLCRQKPIRNRQAMAWRIKNDVAHLIFKDQIQGMFDHHMHDEIGDFVLKRADGQYAYQLAVVVDDAEQNITHVVRGADLLNSTSRQILLQYYLNYKSPVYAHIPLVVSSNGQKLSKQNQAPPLNPKLRSSQLIQAFQFLGLNTHLYSSDEKLSELWHRAMHDWSLSQLPNLLSIKISSLL